MKKKKLKPKPFLYIAAAVTAVLLIIAAGVFLYSRYGTYWKRSSMAVSETTSAVPEEYGSPCAHQGTVIRMDYPSKDYTAESQDPTLKPAFIYLPYGYSETSPKMYDVVYLMHGWMMRAQDFLEEDSSIRFMFDHMIENRETRPFIAVCLTFDKDNEPQSYERSVEELAQFHFELRNDAMPYLESKLNTFAQDTSIEGLKASRNHRAFGGFSFGSVTCWHQFIFNLDLIRGFIPMSYDCWIKGNSGGMYYPKETVDELVRSIHKNHLGLKDYFIYAADGTEDPTFEVMETQIHEMMTRQEFSADNLIWGVREEGLHITESVREYLYNALPHIFPSDVIEATP